VAIINPQHLLDQANLLLAATPGRKPRQVNLRRAISTAYYAAFHKLLIAAADEFVGKTMRNSARYALIYRSVDHGQIRRLCEEAIRQQPSPKYRKFLPTGSFDQEIKTFANNLLLLQAQRHAADYDPSELLTSVECMFAVYLANDAISSIDGATPEGRKAFLTMLLFPPR
jgi:hypothetical protein